MTVKLPLFALGIVGMLVGCGTSEESFIADLAKESCKSESQCNPDSFDAEFEDVADCTEQLEALFVSFGMGDGCTYNGDQARKCLSDAKGLSCEDLESEFESEACETVYTECGEDTDI